MPKHSVSDLAKRIATIESKLNALWICNLIVAATVGFIIYTAV